MGKIRPGNKQNSFLNMEWATHVKSFGKKFTSKRRRNLDKKIIRGDLKELAFGDEANLVEAQD